MTDLKKLLTSPLSNFIPIEDDDEEYELPPYGKADWLIVEVIHTDSVHFPLSVEEHFYGGEGSCFWINDEIGFDYWIGMHFSKSEMSEGWWLIENITATYHHGDGWTTDDDVDYDFDDPVKLDPDKIDETVDAMYEKYK